MTSAGGAQVTVDGKNGSSGALSVLYLFLRSSRSHWLRLECVEGLLHSRVWDLAQVAGTAEAGQSSFLVARLAFYGMAGFPTLLVLQKIEDGSCVSYIENDSVLLLPPSIS